MKTSLSYFSDFVKFLHVRRLRLFYMLIDVVLVCTSIYLAYNIRFDFYIWPDYKNQVPLMAFCAGVMFTSVFIALGVYRSDWRYVGIFDISLFLRAIIWATLSLVTVNYFRNYSFAIIISAFWLAVYLFRRNKWSVSESKVYKEKNISWLLALSLLLGFIIVWFIFHTDFSNYKTLIDLYFAEKFMRPGEFEKALSMPRSVIFLTPLLIILLNGGTRISYRLIGEILSREQGMRKKDRRKVLVCCTDMYRVLLSKTINYDDNFNYQVIGYVSNDYGSVNTVVGGLPVVCTVDGIGSLNIAIDDVFLAGNYLSNEEMVALAENCQMSDIVLRRIPNITSILLHGDIRSVRDIRPDDLIGRLPVNLDDQSVEKFVSNKVVLVTGAGGSIGSEICCQLSQLNPKSIILLGRGENSIYQIQNVLKHRSEIASDQIICEITDVKDREKLFKVIGEYRPDIVFHAAAHKHVPFMENCPEEAVKNNVMGSINVAEACNKFSVGNLVLISTDKAVNLTSYMGISKRIAELALLRRSLSSKTDMVIVRFGNVLGSRGSVVPLFEEQIRRGGPVTVTHKDMTRYFMTIEEAARLVLFSGSVGKSGDICVLNMGEPIRILDMAEKIISLAGKVPHVDIKIEFTGLRPGEALTESLFNKGETLIENIGESITVCRNGMSFDADFDKQIEELLLVAQENKRDSVCRLMKGIISSYGV